VITAALGAPACVVQSDPAPQGPAGEAGGEPGATPGGEPTGTPGGGPEMTVNPPPPEREPGMTVNPPPPGRTLPQAPASGGKVHVKEDGTCWWFADPPECPPNVACNPPRPYEVQCPAEDGGAAPDAE